MTPPQEPDRLDKPCGHQNQGQQHNRNQAETGRHRSTQQHQHQSHHHHHHQQQQHQLPEPLSGASPVLVSRRLLSPEDGEPMLSLPLERRRPDDNASSDDSSPYHRRGDHHRLRSQQLQAWQQLQREEEEEEEEEEESLPQPHANQTSYYSTEMGRRRRRQLLPGTARFPLRWSGGTHFVYAHVGTPPQRVSLIVDTGSFTLAFPCVGCDKCRPRSRTPFWDPGASATAAELSCDECHGEYTCSEVEPRCTYRQSYSEGSAWTATQMVDVLRLGGEELSEEDGGGEGNGGFGWPKLSFGCIRKQSGLFDKQEPDGIIGMGPNINSPAWSLTARESPQNQKFSICFSENGGNLVLGGYDPELLVPGASHQYTTAHFARGFFAVEVFGVALGGRSIVTAETLELFSLGTGTIVDSGTTDMYLPVEVADAFSEAWEAATGEPYAMCPGTSFCLELTPPEAAELPVVSFTLADGVEVRVSPLQYLEKKGTTGETHKTYYAPRIYLTESTGAVLGANVMLDRNVLFDLANERIGFADARCEKHGGTAAYPPAPAALADDGGGSDGEAGGNEEREVGHGGGGGLVIGGGGGGGDIAPGKKEEPAVMDRKNEDESGKSAAEDEVRIGEEGGRWSGKGPREGPGLRDDGGGGRGGGDGDNTQDRNQQDAEGNGGDGDGGGGGGGGGGDKKGPDGHKRDDGDGDDGGGFDGGGTGGSGTKEEPRHRRDDDDGDDGDGFGRGGGGEGGENGDGGSNGGGGEGDGGEKKNGGANGKKRRSSDGGDAAAGGGGGGGGDGDGDDSALACLWRAWTPCRKKCKQDLPKAEGCPGKHEIRSCHTGDRCTLANEGIYADLTFALDFGFSPAAGGTPDDDDNAGAAAAAAAAVFQDQWRSRVGDALASAVASLLPESCGVQPGDVAISARHPGSAAATAAAAEAGGGGDGQLPPPPPETSVVVASVHFWKPEAAMLSASDGGNLDRNGCVSALSAPRTASDLEALVEMEITAAAAASTPAAASTLATAGEAGGEVVAAGAGGGGLAGVAGLAKRIRLVQTGGLAIRTAPSGYRVVDRAAALDGEGGPQSSSSAAAAGGGGVVGFDPAAHEGGAGGGGGDGDGNYLKLIEEPVFRPSAGTSPMMASFAIQIVGIVVLVAVLLVVQRLRSRSSSSSAGGGGGGGGGGQGKAAAAAVAFGGDEEGGGGGGGNGRHVVKGKGK